MTYARRGRAAAPTAVLVVGALALGGCNSGDDNSSSSSSRSTTSSTSSSSTTTSATSTRSSAATSSAPASSSSSAPTSAASSSPASSQSSKPSATSSKPAASPTLVKSCINANSRSNSAVNEWNAAVRSKDSTQLDNAAKGFRQTATYLRTLTKTPGDKQFTPLVWAVAKDFDDMATARVRRQTVSTKNFNSDAQKMRTYCLSKIKV
ncbi:hypothetical protein EU513_08535 [Yimella sp. RIT 621]|uniref:hypothetical protein n=1 Tax=Yimella sp. RIT 621 TaxID=2510323 RepID=UPI00101C8CA1|nr:hypothetical protein [Yimella sp. RIT 621]RYG77350.1 hypothetical protein EU513_08535 [Yimella sp. RIT 621]